MYVQLFPETPHTHPLCRDAVAAANEWQQQQQETQQHYKSHKQHVPRRQQQGRLKAIGVGGFAAGDRWSPREVVMIDAFVDRPVGPFLLLLSPLPSISDALDFDVAVDAGRKGPLPLSFSGPLRDSSSPLRVSLCA